MRQQHRWKLSTVVSAFLCAACLGFSPAGAAERPHGLEPADDMPYMPDLGGLRVKTFKNQYGQVRHLAEGVVMRHSAVADGKATVPAGGFYYISETQEDAAPFMRDPFLILGEHAYLVDLTTEQREVRNVSIERREKKLVDEDGYRLWFDFSTDHYDLPYIQLALISPSGHWPLEFTVSNRFTHIDKIFELSLKEGLNPQLDDYYTDPEYWYGASKFVVK